MRLKHVPTPPTGETAPRQSSDRAAQSPSDQSAQSPSDQSAQSPSDTASQPSPDQSAQSSSEAVAEQSGATESQPFDPTVLSGSTQTTQQVAVELVTATQRAVPLVPGSENDCCARLQRRVGFPSRDVSRTWLTFLRGLGYVEATSDGFRRLRREPTASGVRRGLLDGIVGAREIAAALAREPQTEQTAFAAVSEAVPRWERTRTDDWEAVWRGRTDRLLGWFHALGMVTATSEGYRATEALEIDP